MRFFVITTFILVVSFFSVPLLTVADTSCTTTVNGQDVTGLLVNGVCSVTTVQSQPNTTQTQSQPNTSGTNVKLINPLKSGTSLESFLNNILAYVIRIGTIVVILMIVYVGYLFVIAQGKPGEIEKARSALLWTVVGALILLGSQAIAISIKATVTQLGGS